MKLFFPVFFFHLVITLEKKKAPYIANSLLMKGIHCLLPDVHELFDFPTETLGHRNTYNSNGHDIFKNWSNGSEELQVGNKHSGGLQIASRIN